MRQRHEINAEGKHGRQMQKAITRGKYESIIGGQCRRKTWDETGTNTDAGCNCRCMRQPQVQEATATATGGDKHGRQTP